VALKPSKPRFEVTTGTWRHSADDQLLNASSSPECGRYFEREMRPPFSLRILFRSDLEGQVYLVMHTVLIAGVFGSTVYKLELISCFPTPVMLGRRSPTRSMGAAYDAWECIHLPDQ